MGVAIEFPNFTLECGYLGYLFMFNPKEKKKFLDELTKKINDIDYLANEGSSDEEKEQLAYINNFSWPSDCDAKMSPRHAKAIWHYIQNAEADFSFGYSGKLDCATFQQFKQGIKDCVDLKEGFEWW